MINCLLIGNTKDIQIYSAIIADMGYYGTQTLHDIDKEQNNLSNLNTTNYDALIIVSPIKGIYQILEKEIKTKSNVYFVDQPTLSISKLKKLYHFFEESNNLLFPEALELKHPLIEDFINTTGNHLLFRYNKDISSKNQMRKTLLNALSFLTILSPNQVKKLDVSTMEKTNEGRPAFKIRLQLYDSSIAYIIIKLENKKEHNIIIESKNGNFIFNFSENYLENINGIRFNSPKTDISKLTIKSLESFAHCIILNQKPHFSFYHYSIVFNLLAKFENILLHSF